MPRKKAERSIDVFDLEGNKIDFFISISAAARVLNLNTSIIWHNLNGRVKVVRGKYIFKYANLF